MYTFVFSGQRVVICITFLAVINSLQCFDAVGMVTRKTASGL